MYLLWITSTISNSVPKSVDFKSTPNWSCLYFDKSIFPLKISFPFIVPLSKAPFSSGEIFNVNSPSPSLLAVRDLIELISIIVKYKVSSPFPRGADNWATSTCSFIVTNLYSFSPIKWTV